MVLTRVLLWLLPTLQDLDTLAVGSSCCHVNKTLKRTMAI